MKTLLKLMVVLACLSLVFPLAVLAEDAAPTLLAYYTFDDAENLGADASGNNNNLERPINPDGIQAVEGYLNGAVGFGGSSALTAKDDANNDFMDTYAGKSFTVSFYAKVDLEKASTNNARAVDQGINGSDEGFVVLVNKAVAEDGTVSLFTISKVGGSDWWGSASSVPEKPEDWHHYVMVYDSEKSLVTSFIDGVKMAEVYAEEDEKITSAFTFAVGGNWAQWDWFNGGNHDVAVEGFVGAVDEVKILAGAVYDMDLIAQAK